MQGKAWPHGSVRGPVSGRSGMTGPCGASLSGATGPVGRSSSPPGRSPARPERCRRTAVRHDAVRAREAADRHRRAQPRRWDRAPGSPATRWTGLRSASTSRPGSPQPGRPPPSRSPSPCPRRHRRPVRSRGGPERLQRRRIRTRLTADRFRHQIPAAVTVTARTIASAPSSDYRDRSKATPLRRRVRIRRFAGEPARAARARRGRERRRSRPRRSRWSRRRPKRAPGRRRRAPG